jgi:hypothetical protein
VLEDYRWEVSLSFCNGGDEGKRLYIYVVNERGKFAVGSLSLNIICEW